MNALQNPTFRTIALTAIILVAAFSRVIPHMPNFSPLGAIGLFGAAYFSMRWQAFLIPIMATWLSDLLINNVVYARYYPTFTWFYQGFYWQYGSYVLITAAGILLLAQVNAPRVFLAAMTASLLFFLITNFSAWPGEPSYSQDLSGLLDCYRAGIPYLKGTVLGDVCYSIILFGGFEWLQKRFPSLKFESPVVL